MATSITQLGEATLSRLFKSLSPVFPQRPLDLDRASGVGYMSTKDLGRTGRVFAVWGPALGVKNLEFERDESLMDGVMRCIRENDWTMVRYVIVITENGTQTCECFRLSPEQEREIRIRYARYLTKRARRIASVEGVLRNEVLTTHQDSVIAAADSPED